MKEMKVGRGAPQINARIPNSLKERIKRSADENGRSFNSELISLLDLQLGIATFDGGDDGILMSRITPFGLRIQPVLKARIETAAKANNRSMNAEIIGVLDRHYNPGQIIGSASSEVSFLPLDAEIASVIKRHIDREVQARLLTIANNLNGG